MAMASLTLLINKARFTAALVADDWERPDMQLWVNDFLIQSVRLVGSYPFVADILQLLPYRTRQWGFKPSFIGRFIWYFRTYLWIIDRSRATIFEECYSQTNKVMMARLWSHFKDLFKLLIMRPIGLRLLVLALFVCEQYSSKVDPC